MADGPPPLFVRVLANLAALRASLGMSREERFARRVEHHVERLRADREPDPDLENAKMDLARTEATLAWLVDQRRQREELAARRALKPLAWLRTLLADGPKPKRDIEEQAEEAGFSERTLFRAKARLHIDAVRIGGLGAGGSWLWRLPAKATTKAATSDHVAALADQPVSLDEKRPERAKAAAFDHVAALVSGGEDSKDEDVCEPAPPAASPPLSTIDERPPLTVEAAAKRLNVSVSTIHRMRQRKEIKFTRIGRKIWRVSQAEIDRLLTGNKYRFR
jgi:excisionase family DNA binding protein